MHYDAFAAEEERYLGQAAFSQANIWAREAGRIRSLDNPKLGPATCARPRADIVSWRTSARDHDWTVPVKELLSLSVTSGSDRQLVLNLVDIYSDNPKQGKMAGYELIVAAKIFRGRYRESTL